VNTSLTIKASGSVATHALGDSCGLDLPDAVALTVADGGSISILFDTPAGSGLYYGLRWAGDHEADLQALVDAGKLTWDDTALPVPASIVVQGGYTYVGSAVAVARVTEFTVVDSTSGSSLITNESTVTVNIVGEGAPGETVTDWAITETPDDPASWSSTQPTSYTIAAASGSDVTLYAWVKDTAGNTASKPATIYYNSAAPVVSNVVITAGPEGSGTATVTWDTDIKALGAVKHKQIAAGATETTVSESALGTSHSVVMTGLVTGVNNKVTIVNNEAAGPTIYWTGKWPIPGDANMDCQVNILDLIFIRNKLNQDPNSGSNWQANVNGDAAINILDLIYVRNKLNTHCP